MLFSYLHRKKKQKKFFCVLFGEKAPKVRSKQRTMPSSHEHHHHHHHHHTSDGTRADKPAEKPSKTADVKTDVKVDEKAPEKPTEQMKTDTQDQKEMEVEKEEKSTQQVKDVQRELTFVSMEIGRLEWEIKQQEERLSKYFLIAFILFLFNR